MKRLFGGPERCIPLFHIGCGDGDIDFEVQERELLAIGVLRLGTLPPLWEIGLRMVRQTGTERANGHCCGGPWGQPPATLSRLMEYENKFGPKRSSIDLAPAQGLK